MSELARADLEVLTQWDTPTICNGLDHFHASQADLVMAPARKTGELRSKRRGSTTNDWGVVQRGERSPLKREVPGANPGAPAMPV